jgi:hypothetical protein
MNTYRELEAELQLRTFLTPALDEFERSSPRPRRLIPRTRIRTQTIRGCVGPRSIQDAMKKRYTVLPPPRLKTAVVYSVAKSLY